LHRALQRPDVLCLQEVRIRADDADAIAEMERALPGYVCGHSLCRDPINVRFRGGRAYGVASYVRDDLAPRWLETPSWDLEGRVNAFELPQLNLCVANVYGVNGTAKTYFDRDSRASGDRHAFKLRFQEGLLNHLSVAPQRKSRLVLLGDWNVSRAKIDVYPRLRIEPPHVAARTMFNERFMRSLEVDDVFRTLHPEARKYTWFSRSAARRGRLDAARVDYALVSKALRANVIDAEIAQELGPALGSDHAPLSLQLGV
jgi:exodeoxyribonuclease-3